MDSVIRRLTSIPLAARVLLLGAIITAALTVVAAAREPAAVVPATAGDPASEATSEQTTIGAMVSRGGVGVADVNHRRHRRPRAKRRAMKTATAASPCRCAIGRR
jgi:hypothetical protein